MRRTLLPFALCLTTLAFHGTAEAQRTVPGRSGHGKVRSERVDAMLRPSPKGGLLRTVTPSEGGYAVRVTGPDGTVRMTGMYRDAALQVPHGTFAYHHPDGRLESTGAYVDGRKQGVWARYDAAGRALAERCYGATDMEQVMEANGWASRAALVDGARAGRD